MLRLSAACFALALAASAGAAELYKWVDDKGVINYSNTPPAKTKDGKSATVVEDRTSVYTPERSVTEALERRTQRPPPPPPLAPQPQPPIANAPPPPMTGYDPCANPNDPNCQPYYDGSQVFHGRRRPPPIAQPYLPPGTIAGQSTAQGGTVPGLSGVTPPPPRPNLEPEQRAPFRTR